MNRDSTEDVDSDSDNSLTRRKLVASGAAAWASVALAGCDRLDDPNQPIFGDGDDGDDDGEDGDDDGDDGDDGNGNQTAVTNETTSPGGGGTSSGTPCGSVRNFAAGMDVGLHVNVFDTETGAPLGSDALESVTIEFPDSDLDSRELSWSGAHEVHDEDSWGTKIETSEDIEPGTYTYEITVEGDLDEAETITDQFTIV